MKKAILLHKMARVPFDLDLVVCSLKLHNCCSFMVVEFPSKVWKQLVVLKVTSGA